MTTSTKQVKEVTLLGRYAHKTNRKLNGNVSYLVRNGGGKEYCVTLTANGNSSCVHHDAEKKQAIPESCEASKHGRKCYHIKECQKREVARGWQIPVQHEQADRESFGMPLADCVKSIAIAKENMHAANHVIESDIQAHIEDDITVSAIRNGKLVQVYWNELTEEERQEAVYNICSNQYYY